MANASYTCEGQAADNNGGATACGVWARDSVTARTTSSIRIGVKGFNNVDYDSTVVTATITGDR